MKITAIITTKNRVSLFERAFNSVLKQDRQPDEIIIVSDSTEENFLIEREIVQNRATIIKDIYTHNYAGSLNTALHYKLGTDLFQYLDYNEEYIAFLDDDDMWYSNYLSKCELASQDKDFVITGIRYISEEGERFLTIPSSVCNNDFLKGNPHIQGSNTFIRLSTLLKAGLFDEMLPSTTDRDLFSRVLMLNPTYEIINEYLLDIDYSSSIDHLTFNYPIKQEGLRNFYFKYRGMMSDEIKNHFFDRTRRLYRCGTEELGKLKVDYVKEFKPAFSSLKYEGHLIIGFIATSPELGVRLLKQLVALRRLNTHIVIFINFKESSNDFNEILKDSQYSYQLLSKEDLDEYHYRELVDLKSIYTQETLGISTSRSILQKAMYLSSTNNSVFWILDEDMELYELHTTTGLSLHTINIDNIIETYRNDYDAVIGNYSLDTPLPLFATLRSSLLDCMYFKKSPVQEAHSRDKDYYHDLSDDENLHLETPYPIIHTDITMDDVFGGKATSRYLSLQEGTIKPIKNRGGNTLVFNRDLLLIPNWSLSIGGKQGRRSDFFWAQLAEHGGYKIVNAPFSTLHNRKKTAFSYVDEENKLLKDFIGSSFTKAIEEVGLDGTNKSIHTSYATHFKHRLVKHIANYYRVIGLLRILGKEADKYRDEFSISRLQAFVKRCEYYLDYFRTKAALETLRKKIEIYHHYLDRSSIENILKVKFGSEYLRYLGTGKEGIVFWDNKVVFKYFFNKPENIDFLRTISSQFKDCHHLYPIDIINFEKTCVIRYPYENSKKYSGRYADQIADLIRFAKNNGFVIRNFTNDNFVMIDGVIKFIDYGHSFEPYDETLHKQSIQRAYQVIRYPFLDETEFKELVAMSYAKRTKEIDSGVHYFQHMIEPRSKENLHDGTILQIVKKHNPRNLLDFGAGKCKIGNSLAEITNVSVFDIDQETLCVRANNRVKVIKDASEIPENDYDMILCNLVLCSVDQNENMKIMKQITKAIRMDGVAVFSICNPIFADIEQTEIRTISSPVQYGIARIYEKGIRSTTNRRTEFHRPIEYYFNLLQRFGFSITAVHETDGVDYENMLPVSEHLIFECQLKEKVSDLKNISLLIKSNPMEHRSIYDNIRHIVSQLEKGIRFAERIVVLDTSYPIERNRRYDQDDLNQTLDEINRAKDKGLIDRIIVPNIVDIESIYKKYFKDACLNPYSENGQALFSTLAGFESIKTDYVFQTDSDILYFNNTFGEDIKKAIRYLDEGAITVSPSISREKTQDTLFGNRTEVRTCFLNLKDLTDMLPLPNEINEGKYTLPWHRSLDIVLNNNQSVRMVSSQFYFIHPENEEKTIPNLVQYARNHIEMNPSIASQMNEVNLHKFTNKWVRQTTAPMVLYIRGYNTSCSKLKRLFDSLRNQDHDDFEVVYIDDASTNQSGIYAKLILEHDPFFSSKSIFVGNDVRQHILPNLVFVMQNIIFKKNTIVVHIDNDDYLLTNHALSRIKEEYNKDAQLTVGNCVRYNKPLKHYRLYSFENVWERGGDNVWLHPKTHLRSLFDYVIVNEDLKIDGHYIDVNTDFAFMLPMIEKSVKSVFIPDLLYYFEPSHDNISQENQYEKKHKDEIKVLILKKARERHEKNSNSNRR